MALFLAELEAPGRSRAEVRSLLDRLADVARRAGAELVEAQVAASLRHVYAVVEHGDERGGEAALAGALQAAGLPTSGLARVQLIGATLDEVRAARGGADYLVEWDFPAGLTMDAYLARKRANAPRYAEVPEVRFLRTYVCEDMSRCLCFYLAHDEAAVRRAREAVGAPVSRLTPLAGTSRRAAGPGAPAAPAAPPGGRATEAPGESA
jgi:hypothetical protein